MVGKPRRTGRRRQERVQLVLIHYRVDSLGARKPVIILERVEISPIRQRPFRLGPHQDVLPEERHLFFAVAFVEFDDFLERMDWSLGAYSGDVSVQIGLEFVFQYVDFGLIKLPDRSNFHRIDKHRALAPYDREKRIHQRGEPVVEIEEFPDYSNASPAQSAAIEKFRVV